MEKYITSIDEDSDIIRNGIKLDNIKSDEHRSVIELDTSKEEDIVFKNIFFKHLYLNLKGCDSNIKFENCNFKDTFVSYGYFEVEFEDCWFNNKMDFKKCECVKFKSCSFLEENYELDRGLNFDTCEDVTFEECYIYKVFFNSYNSELKFKDCEVKYLEWFESLNSTILILRSNFKNLDNAFVLKDTKFNVNDSEFINLNTDEFLDPIGSDNEIDIINSSELTIWRM